MRAQALILALTGIAGIPIVGAETTGSVELFVPDGQLKSHPVKVFVTTDLTSELKPTLILATPDTEAPKDVTDPTVRGKGADWIGNGQKWTQVIDGQPQSFTGTLLLFNLTKHPVSWWKPTMRFTPVLSFLDTSDPGKPLRRLVGAEEIYLGNLSMAIVWTLLLEAVIVVALALSARKKTGDARYLLCGPDGYYSLWRTQLAAWTLAIGGAVFCFGTIRLSVPHIPESLVALMGMSLATGMISSAQARSGDKSLVQAKAGPDGNGSQTPATADAATAATDGGVATSAPPEPQSPKSRNAAMPTANEVGASVTQVRMNPASPAFADLITAFNKDLNRVELSIPKAQMFYWTVLILVLFVTKTLLSGQLWEVPWELVGLTGFSQAGYVGDKFIRPPSS